MRTAIVSDLHLGTRSERDLLRHAEVREALARGLEGADRVVLLGDVLELRDSPIEDALARATPVLKAIGETIRGAEVVLTAGNHDHRLAAETLRRAGRLNGGPPLSLSEEVAPAPDTLAGRIAAALGGSVTLSYPGVRVREDVWATHGHYLDAHNTVPAFEAVSAAAAGRRSGRLNALRLTPDDYEAALGPIYAWLFERAQRPGRSGAPASAGASVRILERLRDGKRTDPVRVALERFLIPGAVGAINLAGLGQFRPDLSGAELRRAGLRAIGEAVSRLGVEADHIVFGHTHRQGPLRGDAPHEWRTPSGATLHNTGSWVTEPWLVRGDGRASPYWPGNVMIVEDVGPPRLQRVLDTLPDPP